MQQVNIKFNNIKQVQQFVNMIINFDAHVDLGCGQKVVNAKSILGVFALDLSEPLLLSYTSKDTEFIEKIKPFIYKENAANLDHAG